jgi:hypothetical protein
MLILTSTNVVDCSVRINTTYPITVFFAVTSIGGAIARGDGIYASNSTTSIGRETERPILDLDFC